MTLRKSNYQKKMEDKRILRLKIKSYEYEGKVRYLAEIKYSGGKSVSFNESTMNKLWKCILNEVKTRE